MTEDDKKGSKITKKDDNKVLQRARIEVKLGNEQLLAYYIKQIDNLLDKPQKTDNLTIKDLFALGCLCPITRELFDDPVETPAGDVYSRTSITDFINIFGEDPYTGQPLKISNLIPVPELAAICATLRGRNFELSESEKAKLILLDEKILDSFHDTQDTNSANKLLIFSLIGPLLVIGFTLYRRTYFTQTPCESEVQTSPYSGHLWDFFGAISAFLISLKPQAQLLYDNQRSPSDYFPEVIDSTARETEPPSNVATIGIFAPTNTYQYDDQEELEEDAEEPEEIDFEEWAEEFEPKF